MKIYAMELPCAVSLIPSCLDECSSAAKAIPWAALLSLAWESWSLELFTLCLQMTL